MKTDRKNRVDRTQIIYGNCQVLAPNGKLMFRCTLKRINWYLKRNLAEIVNEDPLTIKLSFEPKGVGESVGYLKIPRENKCVVCGDENVTRLTKHHLIPYEYRKWFPNELKSNNSAYIVVICRKDHDIYEEKAKELKNVIAQKYNAPLKQKPFKLRNKVLTLLNYSDKVPKERIELIKQQIISNTKYKISKEELEDKESLTRLVSIMKDKNDDDCHGKIVVDQLQDYETFSKEWVKHFVETMNPKHFTQGMKEFLGI